MIHNQHYCRWQAAILASAAQPRTVLPQHAEGS